MTRRAVLPLLAAAILCGGCVETLEPGEYGRFRYMGNVNGEVPLDLLPPTSDREGNAYVLFGDTLKPGDPDLPVAGVQLFIGQAGGGWDGDNSCCESVDNDCDLKFPASHHGHQFGPHGFVGRSDVSVWYWAGEALVRASGISGMCSQVLDDDPSGSDLAFRAVIPWVRLTPSTTTTLAWIQTALDPRPFSVVIDLKNDVYTQINELTPSKGHSFLVLGVGGDRNNYEGVVVARYTKGTDEAAVINTRAYFYNHKGTLVEDIAISGLDSLPEHGIVGYLQSNDNGLYAGLDVEGQLIVLDKSGADRKPITSMTPAGIHEWEGQLYLVGEAGGKPKIAAIEDDGDLGKVRTWKSAEDAADGLDSKIDVIDDRSLPSRAVSWKDPRNALGGHMFLNTHRLDYYAEGTTTWLIAGPSYGTSGGTVGRTAVAYVPVGIAYEE